MDGCLQHRPTSTSPQFYTCAPPTSYDQIVQTAIQSTPYPCIHSRNSLRTSNSSSSSWTSTMCSCLISSIRASDVLTLSSRRTMYCSRGPPGTGCIPKPKTTRNSKKGMKAMEIVWKKSRKNCTYGNQRKKLCDWSKPSPINFMPVHAADSAFPFARQFSSKKNSGLFYVTLHVNVTKWMPRFSRRHVTLVDNNTISEVHSK